MKNKIWLGPSISSGDREFQVPNDYPLEAATYRVDKDGNKFLSIKIRTKSPFCSLQSTETSIFGYNLLYTFW